MSRKEHIVALRPEERKHLTGLVATTKASAFTQTRAYVLLKADATPAGPGWDDARIADAYMVSLSTVVRIRQRYARRGLAAALARKPQEHPSRRPILDPRRLQELVRQSPRSFGKKTSTWTLQLLADTCSEVGIVDGKVCDDDRLADAEAGGGEVAADRAVDDQPGPPLRREEGPAGPVHPAGRPAPGVGGRVRGRGVVEPDRPAPSSGPGRPGSR